MRSIIPASALAALLPLTALAQGPVLQTSVPARHSLNGSRTAPVQLNFSQPVTNPATIRVNTSQLRGRRAGTFAGAGTSQVSFQPAQPFAPGELVSVTVPASVSTPARVVEFRAATASGLATFNAPLIIGPASNPPSNAVAGDIDNDGDLDLVASEVSNVSIYRNNGSGQFTASQAGLVAAASAGDLLLADVNGDGNLDLLSSSSSQAGVYLSLGTGTGSFQARTMLHSVALPSQIVTGDFNADGLVDVVVGEMTAAGMTLHFIPGASSGPLAATRSMPVAFNMRDLGAADMDEDGDLDLVALSEAQLTMCLNDGSGQFAPGAMTTINPFSMRLTVGDFTGDGHADVACSSYQTANVSLVPGNGAGGWEPMRSVPALSRTWHVRAGDMDGDADLDMLVTNDRGITQVMLNNGNGTFAPAASVLIGWEQFTMADAADLNGDGVLDVYAGNGTSSPSGPHGINIFFNQPRVTSTKSSVATLAFTAFPNPARGEVRLQLPAGTAPTTVELRDALGRLVRTLPAAQAATRVVPLTGLAPGRYAVLTYTKQARGAQWIVVE